MVDKSQVRTSPKKATAGSVNKGTQVYPNDRILAGPEGLWVKCTQCGEILQSRILAENQQVCPECSHHFRMGAWERISHLTGNAAFEELGERFRSLDPLQFVDLKPYRDRLEKAESITNQSDAIITGFSSIAGPEKIKIGLGVFEFRFMGGSMGAVVGEKICELLEAALHRQVPVIIVSTSGGARMQEGILSLMQMAKTVSLVKEMKKNSLPFVSVLADPTTGGVAASFAMVGDVILAEPNALVGFAGPRIIGQTMRQELPAGFQRSEFLLKHGFIDAIISRKELPATISKILNLFMHGTWQKNRSKK